MPIKDQRVAVLATDGFEESELTEPVEALTKAGAKPVIVSLKDDPIRGVKGHEWTDTVAVDRTIADVREADFDALLLPGGVYNPDTLRQDQRAVAFVRAMFEAKKPIAAICHGPWLLAEADVVKDRRVTSYASIETDLVNAGAQWVDEPVVVHQGLTTSRSPDDLEAFCAKLIEEVGEGRHERRGPPEHAAPPS